MRVRGYSLEEWQAILEGYGEALVFAANLWVPGPWALIGAAGALVLAALCHALFPGPYRTLRVLFAPVAGGFAGGYFYALSLQAQTCAHLTGLLCLISVPPAVLAKVILGSMLCVVGVYLALPGRKIPGRFRRPGLDRQDGDPPEGDPAGGDPAGGDLADV